MTILANMIGRMVSFRSKHPNDSVVYVGTIKGLVDYSVAKTHNDIVSYRGQVYTQDSTIADVEDLNYFLMGLNEDDPTNERTISFASEFIDGVVTVISSTGSADFRVWGIDITTAPDKILEVLRAAGYHRVKTLTTRS